MGVTLPFTIEDGQDIDAEPLQSNFAALAAKFNGGITDEDISTSAAISGAKLGVGTTPGSRIANKSISQSEMGLLSVGTPELIALAVTKAKVAANDLTNAQLALFVATKAFSTGTIATGGQSVTTVTPPATISASTNTLLGVYLYGVTFTAGSRLCWSADAFNNAGNWEGKVVLNNTASGVTGGLTAATFAWVYMTAA